MSIKKIKTTLRYLRDANMLNSDNRQLIQNHYKNKIYEIKTTDDSMHLQAAIDWLRKAQNITNNGGFSGRYSLKTGWSPAYPETTGYLVPTMLRLGKNFNDESFIKQAEDAINFLFKLQMDNGAFPGGELDSKPEPSVFNTGQILNGITAWYNHTKDNKVLDIANKAGDWLASVQDDDGAFRKFAYNGITVSYSSHSSCWLAELGKVTDNKKYLDVAEKHIDWVLTNYDDSTGWIDSMGFFKEDHKKRISVVHTIAYTLWGILFTAIIVNRKDAIEKVTKASRNIADTLNKLNWLPGMLNHKWEGVVDYSCLTGNAQMALVWMKLYEITDDNYFKDSVIKIIDLVKASQSLESKEPGIKGGIPGSYPIWGGYIYMALPNWAAKFFIDALLEKQRIFSNN